ncbi:hypothetical protein ROJ8625_03314 [Roseivivax jejudonensis]|uniref:DUF1127 domain-containing protein n=1 Tax=Roseivivax jejudonensis TaxID=1529041 RepID=A0A1X6ZYN4_9RHOB|nr:DUF1127 domain-containing protein [Roseivivax jejudonensis]SLN65072.1 hypothetical protein ROJ8625_03314 [Roseivivax jejudonensis]
MTATYINSMPEHRTERRGVFKRVFGFLVMVGESNHRAHRVQELSKLSDRELEKRGLKREEIAHHVFRDMFYV